MVPENIAQMLTALKTPDFFIRDNRTATESIHDILRDYLARATDTMTVEVDAELLMVKMYELLDLHLGHANAIRFDNRPFADVDEMNESLIRSWNSMVTKQDTVYVLGDFI